MSKYNICPEESTAYTDIRGKAFTGILGRPTRKDRNRLIKEATK